jgi:hypothetical protein
MKLRASAITWREALASKLKQSTAMKTTRASAGTTGGPAVAAARSALDQFGREHASSPAIDRDFKLVRPESWYGHAVSVDDLHVDGDDVEAGPERGLRFLGGVLGAAGEQGGCGEDEHRGQGRQSFSHGCCMTGALNFPLPRSADVPCGQPSMLRLSLLFQKIAEFGAR